MMILNRYISFTVLKGWLVILLILLPIFSFIELVQLLDDVGKGNFTTLDAFRYVALNMPARAVDLAPITAMLGSIVALGLLANNSELIAMRASGVSILQISGFVMKTSLVIMLAVALLSEFLAPQISQYAEQKRMLAVSKSGDLLKGEGYWSRDGHRYLNIRKLLHGRIPTDIRIYEFDPEGQLLRYTHADHAEVKTARHWLLHQVLHKEIKGSEVVNEIKASLPWQPFPALIQQGRIEIPVQRLSPSNLYRYIQYLHNAGQNAQRPEQMFWHKVLLPVSIGALMLFALPFVFGSLRSANFGLRVTLGVIAGLVYSLFDQLLANLGLLLGLNPIMVAAAPILLVVLISLGMLRVTR